ncbi:MAG TPA: hypothetical protein VGZ27_05870 [Vicinamibacterales bacterium]|nr:hypothetical protein [Vicinamibacterales bacterium]
MNTNISAAKDTRLSSVGTLVKALGDPTRLRILEPAGRQGSLRVRYPGASAFRTAPSLAASLV